MNRLAGALLACAVVAGCASFDEKIRPAREAYEEGRYTEAAAAVAPFVEAGGKDKPIFLLEQALPLLAQGKAAEAEAALKEVRDRFDAYEKQVAAEWVAAALTDDTAIAYPGEDYEKVLIRVVLALANLLGRGTDAIAYANQVIDKQTEILERSPEFDGKKIKANYKRIGVGRYLVGLLREAEYDYASALTCARDVAVLEPQFAYAKEDAERAEKGVHSRKGNGVLYVFALVDRGPFKIQVSDVPTTVALHMVWIMGSIMSWSLVTPSIFPVKVPELVAPERTMDVIDVAIDGKGGRPTSEIMNVQAVAEHQFKETHDWVVARAFLRRLLKKGLIETGKRIGQHQLRRDDDIQVLVELAAAIANAVWEAIEVADTRCWGTLPASIQVVRLEIPVGVHAVELRPAWRGSPVGAPVTVTVEIEDDRNAYCVAFFPSVRARPEAHVSPRPFDDIFWSRRGR
jgi:uncharacterized protein